MQLTDDGRALVHSFAGDPFKTCAGYLGLAHVPAQNVDRSEFERLKQARQAEAQRLESERLAFCHRLWSAAEPVDESPGAAYLDARGVVWFPADVRYHPAAARGYSSSATAPALLALARSVTGAPRAVQATFLRSDHRANVGRVTFGSLLGAAVRLGDAEETLAVAEGLETAASYAELEGVPTWATLGTSNLEAFQPPARVRHLIIAADGDDAGLKAARGLAERVRSRCDVSIAQAPIGWDWNDVARGRVNV